MGDLLALNYLDSPFSRPDTHSIFAAARGEHQHLVGVASQAIEAPPAAGLGSG
jgi:hypothetical protein